MIKNLIANHIFENNPPNSYYKKHLNRDLDRSQYEIGGMFDLMGDLHLNLLIKYGLKPDMKFIDIGCGAFRSGVKIIKYLEQFNYYGIDVNASLVHAGLNVECKRYNVQDKIREENFCLTDNFELDQFNIKFDMGLAQSVFTHLPINYVHYCLVKIAPFFNKNAKFLTTFFFCEEDKDITKLNYFISDTQFETSYIYDPFHLKKSYLINLFNLREIENLWNVNFLNDAHPRKQSWVLFTRK